MSLAPSPSSFITSIIAGVFMLDFEILLSDSFTRADLLASYNPGPGEPRSQEATERIDKVWHLQLQTCKQDGLRIFNGHLIRLNSYARKDGKTILELGNTTFREYIGTSIEDFYGAFPEAWMANPLAVCIALVTSDRKILVEKRTLLTQYRAPFHVIGGFMEPEKDLCDGRPDPFFAITREVREELGLVLIPDRLVALGLVRNLFIRHPEIVFCYALRESFNDVREVLENSVTDDEIDQLEAAEDTSDGLASFLRTHHGLFTPSGEACLLLYGRRMYGEGWYDALFEELTER
jgi:8-oxo-dGTP pyrophosphatase MutT (NUDIX family)